MHIIHLAKPTEEPCSFIGCLREADIYCDLCNREACKHHSYRMGKSTIICEQCMVEAGPIAQYTSRTNEP